NNGGDFGQGGTLPDSFGNLGSTTFSGVVVVSSDVRAFINFNRESMPELPFNMLVESWVTGATSSGQTVNTNKVFIEVLFTADVVVPPADGTTGTGAQTEGSTDDQTTDESTSELGTDAGTTEG
ncbi:MAG: hypothetical protein KDD62_09165, partial [Bdellovibrionales bacterium]|nr:hypothetical protein [Bdellovibrionales bacterium]